MRDQCKGKGFFLLLCFEMNGYVFEFFLLLEGCY